MNRIIQLAVISIALFIPFFVFSQNEISVSKYNIDVDMQDTVLNIDVSLCVQNIKNRGDNYLLFNSLIDNYSIKTSDSSFKYKHKSDTLFFNSSKPNIELNLKYNIPWHRGLDKNKNMDKNPLQIVKSDELQVFFERYYRWYPVLYDNFSNYKLMVKTDSVYGVFSSTSVDSVLVSDNKKTYVFSLYEEDIPFLITKLDIFNYKTFRTNNTNFNFYFLKKGKRLLEVKNNKPIFTNDCLEIDSINKCIYDRCIKIAQWYKKNLAEKEIQNINFIESTSSYMGGFGLNNLIYLTSQMINYDLYYKYQISHEIGHIWIGLNTKYEEAGRNFVSESINEYVNLLLYEDFYGKQNFDKLLNDEFIVSSSTFNVSLKAVLNIRKNFNLKNQEQSNIDILIYKKGPLFLHEFRKEIGTAKFLKIINDTYTQEKKLITINDFEQSIKNNNCWAEYLKLYELKL